MYFHGNQLCGQESHDVTVAPNDLWEMVVGKVPNLPLVVNLMLKLNDQDKI